MFDEWKEDYELMMGDDYTFRRPGCHLMHKIIAYATIIWCDTNCRPPIINCYNRVLDWVYKGVVDFLGLLDEIVLFGHCVVLDDEGEKFVNGIVGAVQGAMVDAALMGLFNDDNDD